MAKNHIARSLRCILCLLPALFAMSAGCGQTRTRTATDQLLMSDAVDRTVSKIDFGPLSGQKVYLDTTYLKPVKGVLFVNADYIISSLRQQMMGAGCLLEEDKAGAEFIVEARVGALGTDGHEVTYGVPASSGLSTAASLLPNAPPIPMIPEISVARKNDYRGAAKIALFAYHQKTKQPVWQSGVTVAASDAKEAWVFGAGPIQYGTVFDGTRFAGDRIHIPWWKNRKDAEPSHRLVSYYEEVDFRKLAEQQKASETGGQNQNAPTAGQTPASPRGLPPGLDAVATPVPPRGADTTKDEPKPPPPAQSPPPKPAPTAATRQQPAASPSAAQAPPSPKPSPAAAPTPSSKPPSPVEPDPSPNPPAAAEPKPSPTPPPPSKSPTPDAN